MENNIYDPKDIEAFVAEHIQQKSPEELEWLKNEYNDGVMSFYGTILFEGIINGIIWAGGKIKGINED